MRKRWVLAFWIAMLAAPVGGTTLARMSLKKLTAAATAIVRARCLGNSGAGAGNAGTERGAMNRALARFAVLLIAGVAAATAAAYSLNYVVPSTGGCPVPTRMATTPPISRRWSTSLSTSPQTIFTVAAPGTSQQSDEIQQTILDAFSAWTGVPGTTLNATSFSGALAPLTETSTQDACANDQGGNLSGVNTICFNQSSSAFTAGVLAFTRLFAATASGQTIGTVTSSFTGQILESDIEFENNGQATFATPGALASNPSSYDLESILTHELGHFFGLEHSPVWRAVMSPFAPAPGTFWGPRPTSTEPDAPLRDDDLTGLRVLYPDPSDTTDTGAITGRVVPANAISLAGTLQPAAGEYVTGIFGANVVAVDAQTGQIVAAAIAGWSCPSPSATPVFDGTYTIARLPLGRSYNLYIEPLDGVVSPADLGGNSLNPCSTTSSTPCTSPPGDANFVAHVRPAG
ncbi:MAG TPA: matrixin family metalloprotease [Patescibacteria group bacterium]|nr:matrixin family metalloprotease [Patescibacteria group bacterium]